MLSSLEGEGEGREGGRGGGGGGGSVGGRGGRIVVCPELVFKFVV